MSARRAPTHPAPTQRTPAQLEAARKTRPRRELVMALLQPLATFTVGLLARTPTDPQAVVWLHTAFGVAAAALIAFADPSSWPWAAALLVAKTLLDNVDGGLARATGRVTEMGRYLDSVLDTIVNALLLLALAVHGPDTSGFALAVGAYLLLMVMLSLDFNLERRYRALRQGTAGNAQPDPAGAPAWALGFFRGFYRVVLAPQDRVIDRLDEALFARLYGLSYARAPERVRHAWNDLFSTATLVNLGLSSQLLLLAVLLLAGQPFAYVLALWAMAGYVLLVGIARIVRFKLRVGVRR